ncbi:unnamed protein product, partial [Symbiodinium sp. KB8]
CKSARRRATKGADASSWRYTAGDADLLGATGDRHLGKVTWDTKLRTSQWDMSRHGLRGVLGASNPGDTHTAIVVFDTHSKHPMLSISPTTTSMQLQAGIPDPSSYVPPKDGAVEGEPADRDENPGVFSGFSFRGPGDARTSAQQRVSQSTSAATGDADGAAVLTAMPEAKDGAESALTFQDWLVEVIYEKWLAASPLERLNIEPADTGEWTTGRWARVNARAATMILTAMPEQLRLDMVARRAAQNCVKMMFRAYTHYQPGGGSPDLARVATLDGALPESANVTAYQRHLQAELETMLAKDGGSKTAGSLDLCRYFAKASGCKRGDKCSYSHSMSSMEKDVRARKCLKCGWCQQALSRDNSSCICAKYNGYRRYNSFDPGGATGCATTASREYRSKDEWDGATEVMVQLAGSYSLVMRITESGTLLMPYKGDLEDGARGGVQAQTIVPMGQLIQTLGYTMVWSKDSCYLESQEGERVPLQVTGGCPQLQEMEALSLIARLEERKKEELDNAVLTTKDKLGMCALAMERTWEYYLMDYILTGSFESGLRAVRDAPFFADLPGECLWELIPTKGLWSGWEIMKDVGYFTRAQRRKIIHSKRWVVHLFAGKEGHWEIMKLDQGDTTVIELDIARCKGHDLLRDETWRMLLWGAKEGKIDVILGGPPARSSQRGSGGERQVKDVALLARMMWLHAMSQVGREVNGTPRSKNRDVGFVLEYPETMSEAAEEEIIAAREQEVRDPRGRGEAASWNYANWYWAFTPEQWKQHVDSNHEVYRKDCLTCVTSRGTGRQHRRVHHPESYVLTADVAGPLSRGLDPTSKGTMGKNLKYLVVAKYVVPKAYVQLHSGVCPPGNNGCDPEDCGDRALPQEEQDDLLRELFGEDDPGAQEEELETVEVIQLPEQTAVDRQVELEDCMEYEPSEPGEEVQEEKLVQVDALEGSQDQVMANGDCKPPELTFLIFAVGVENNQSSTVKRALQDIVLYLEMHSFPIYRFHSDKGEFFNHSLRSWLRDHSIYATYSEPGIPQGNGHAEGAVRWTKDRVRTLLRSSSLPTRLWPAAAAAAAAQQRAKVLGWSSFLAAPFGADVHLKRKAFDEKGPQRREQSLESKWQRGKYVGLSTILHHGHLVYVPAEGDEKEKFFHTAHVRPNLIDPGQPSTELLVEPPKPKRKVVEKSRIEDIEMRVVRVTDDEVRRWATEEARDILNDWDLYEAKLLINKLAKAEFFNERKFGVYRHGGSVGWMKGVREFPDLVRLLTRFVTEVEPTATFTSVLVSYNTQKPLHKDFNNDPRTYNYVIPTQRPSSGGELWIELKPGDCIKGVIEQRSKKDRTMYGQCLRLEEDKAIRIGPMSAHEVCHWEGDRIVVIGYSPQCLGKLNQDDVTLLHDYGFPIPISQLPEYYANEEAEEIYLRPLTLGSEECMGSLSEEPDWTMYLDLNPGMARITDSAQNRWDSPQLHKAEVGYTMNIEKVLDTLSGPLDVTHTVNPAEVLGCLELWKPAIEKELKSIEVAIERLSPGTEARKRWLNSPGAQRLPTKFVFTVKPNDQADPADPSTWYKRKARLVVCGNMAAQDGAAVYTETAPAEAVRAGLTMATRYKWSVAVLDVVAAFLRTPMNRSKGDPIVVVQPPRLLETMGLIVPLELWGLMRALYGLRQSPALWGDFRDYTLRTSPPPEGMRLQQGGAVTSWWKVVDEKDDMIAIVLVYVDDFLLCGPTEVVKKVAKWIQEIWETSNPTFLAPGAPIRFLGMELHVDEQFPDEVGIGQQGYIQELLRLHAVPSTALDKIPVSKELVSEREPTENVNQEDVHLAQQLTGEILWLAQRSRPDLSYATSMMASLCLRQPKQTIEIGMKALGYLQKTAKYQLKIKWSGESLLMYCDAAYAPQGAKSHGGWLVLYGGAPIMWRSGRQQMVTLSTAEAELLAMIDGAIAMKGIEALLSDLGQHVEEKVIASDSTAALSISTGSTSWRTRHLKIKANWLQEQIQHGVMMLMLMVLGALLIWEAVRWLLIEVYNEWPNERKLIRCPVEKAYKNAYYTEKAILAESRDLPGSTSAVETSDWPVFRTTVA